MRLIKITGWLLLMNLGAPVSAVEAEVLSEADYAQKLTGLDRISYHPNLLPIIMQNRDYLELTPAQLDAFRSWRKQHFADMFAKMQEIVRLRDEFNDASLRSSVTQEALKAMQQNIFRLHEEVLNYKLSCRKNIIDTFTAEQWEGLQFLMRDQEFAALN